MSNASCFPEVAGDAAIYFNPHDAQSMLDALQLVVESPALRDELRLKGLQRAKEFTLDRMVQNTCEVYRKLL